MYINADHLRTKRRKPVPDTGNAEVLPDLREAVAGYRYRTILQQCPVRKQIHSDGGTWQTMGKRRLEAEIGRHLDAARYGNYETFLQNCSWVHNGVPGTQFLRIG